MALTLEWRGRIDQYRSVLQTLFYRPLGKVALKGFVTSEQLTPPEAMRHSMRAMPEGTRWGAKWEYAWFRGSVRLPAEARGKRIALRHGADVRQWTIDSGGDARVVVNGRDAGESDFCHREITLARNGVPGTKYDVMFEVYAGHGPIAWHIGPLPDGRAAIPEAASRQRMLEPVSFGIWEEEVYQAWLDFETLVLLRDNLDADSLRVAEIDEGLKAFTVRVDVELPREEMLRTVAAGRRLLKPLLSCRNGSTAPLFYCFGHSHIDIAWLWPLQETERKCARTFSTQLALMEEYPEFKFLQSQAHLYRMTKQTHPELYRRIKTAVKRGRFIPEGSMWVEADTNVTGGESLIRQFMYGLKYFRDEFGVRCKLMWLPDVFGYSGAIPQLIAGCGLKYFSTQKIFWTYNGGEVFPYNTFWWEGIDGTRVLSHIHNDYNSHTDPATLIQRWKQLVQKSGTRARLVPFGYGDGGGGVTRTHLEYLRRQRNLEGAPRTVISHPLDFFRNEERELRRRELPVYVGELYYQAHRGTYTTQARTKRGNRLCELALREAELWGGVAGVLKGYRYPAAELEGLWKDVLLNQFHDIIPGSSIERVYREAEALHASVLKRVGVLQAKARASLVARRQGAVTVFNSLSWRRTALVQLPRGWRGATGIDGTALPVQMVGKDHFVEVSVPCCGWTTIASGPASGTTGRVVATPVLLENDQVRARVNDRGEIISLVDKASGRELAEGPLNALRMYRDTPRNFEAWDIDSNYTTQPVALESKARIRVLATGPLVGVLLVERTIGKSLLTQEIRLRRGSRRIEFRTVFDWHEKHKLLKVNFPTVIHANEAVHEIQFGHIRRPNHESRPFDADRFEVCNQKWTALCEENRGVAVLNDCKYGVDVDGGSINLTLMRAPMAPDAHADQGRQEFAYAFHAWNGSLFDSDVVRESYELNVPCTVTQGSAGEESVFSVAAPNVVIETVKPAEDGSGDLVVRLYEAKRTATTCTLETSLPVKQAVETNMLEEGTRQVSCRSGRIALSFRPFEIKTLCLRF